MLNGGRIMKPYQCSVCTSRRGKVVTDLGLLCDPCYKEEFNRRQDEVTNSRVDDSIESTYHDHMERGGYHI